MSTQKQTVLSYEGLKHFYQRLLNKFVSQEEAITNEEIDEICGASIVSASEVKF